MPSRCGGVLTAVVAVVVPVTGLAAIAGRGTLLIRRFVTARGAGGRAAVTRAGADAGRIASGSPARGSRPASGYPGSPCGG